MMDGLRDYFTTLLIIIALAFGFTSGAKAQASSPPAAPDSVISVSLLTAAPGSEIYQLEGHSGLRIRTTRVDYVANWGIFDFNQPNFIYRFVKGETDYCVGLIPFSYFMSEYAYEHRRVLEQTLNLTPGQTQRLVTLVNEAVRPESRTYRYNYVLDNCATRCIGIVEEATGDSLHFPVAMAELGDEVTFRSVMRRYHRNYPWYQFGIDMALGSGIDYPLSVRQTAFAPVVLSEIAAHATIGDSIPLVKSTTVLLNGAPEGPIAPPTPWYLTPLTVFWTLAAICLASSLYSARTRRLRTAWLGLYFAVLGLVGCVIAFLVFISTHEATTPNWIILWLNPLCLIVPLLIGFRRCRPIVRWYMMANIFMIILYWITCAFGTQSPNPAFLPLSLSDLILSLSFLHVYNKTHNRSN